QALHVREAQESVAPARGHGDVADREDRARRADALLPARVLIAALHALELELGRDLGLAEALAREAALAEEAPAEAHAAHARAVLQERREARAGAALGAPPADVDHEASTVDGRLLVRDAEVDEARLLAARQHLDREAERRARAREQVLRLAHAPERVGG